MPGSSTQVRASCFRCVHLFFAMAMQQGVTTSCATFTSWTPSHLFAMSLLSFLSMHSAHKQNKYFNTHRMASTPFQSSVGTSSPATVLKIANRVQVENLTGTRGSLAPAWADRKSTQATCSTPGSPATVLKIADRAQVENLSSTRTSMAPAWADSKTAQSTCSMPGVGAPAPQGPADPLLDLGPRGLSLGVRSQELSYCYLEWLEGYLSRPWGYHESVECNIAVML